MSFKARIEKLESQMPPTEQGGAFMQRCLAVIGIVYGSKTPGEKSARLAALGPEPEPQSSADREFSEKLKKIYGAPQAKA